MDVLAGVPLMEVLSASSRARQTGLRSNGQLHPPEETEARGMVHLEG